MSPDCLAGTRTNPGNRVSMRGSSRLLIAQIIRFQFFAAIAKRDRFKYSKRPLSHRPCYGKWRHMPPRDLERTPCRHPCWAESLWEGSYHNRRKKPNWPASAYATLTSFFSRSASVNRVETLNHIPDNTSYHRQVDHQSKQDHSPNFDGEIETLLSHHTQYSVIQQCYQRKTYQRHTDTRQHITYIVRT